MNQWLQNRLEGSVPEALRLFSFAEVMKWNHLPIEGGFYDQHPLLIDYWEIIFQERAAHEERERKKEESKNKRAQRRPKG